MKSVVSLALAIASGVLMACTPAPTGEPGAAALLAKIQHPDTKVVRRCADGKTTIVRPSDGRLIWVTETWAATRGDYLPTGTTPESFCT